MYQHLRTGARASALEFLGHYDSTSR